MAAEQRAGGAGQRDAQVVPLLGVIRGYGFVHCAPGGEVSEGDR